MEWWFSYLCLGAVVGFFAGLLGIGGGLIMVPVLSFLFSAQNFSPDRILHLALGTSMAAIIFTSVSSMRVHHIKGAVNWHIVKNFSPGIILGTLCGATLANSLSGKFLSIFIVLFIYYAAIQLMFNKSVKPNRQLPGKIGMCMVGGFIGGVSSLVAIGGGILTVPFLSACNVRLQHAIGTAAAIGFPIAVVGTIGYIINGMTQPGVLPEYSIGYVYLPALTGIVLCSTIVASIGAKVTHTTQTKTIKKIFVLLMLLLATKMLVGFI